MYLRAHQEWPPELAGGNALLRLQYAMGKMSYLIDSCRIPAGAWKIICDEFKMPKEEEIFMLKNEFIKLKLQKPSDAEKFVENIRII